MSMPMCQWGRGQRHYTRNLPQQGRVVLISPRSSRDFATSHKTQHVKGSNDAGCFHRRCRAACRHGQVIRSEPKDACMARVELLAANRRAVFYLSRHNCKSLCAIQCPSVGCRWRDGTDRIGASFYGQHLAHVDQAGEASSTPCIPVQRQALARRHQVARGDAASSIRKSPVLHKMFLIRSVPALSIRRSQPPVSAVYAWLP